MIKMSLPSFPRSKPERGNALFLILIAVALFAALSYAITQSGRGGGGTSPEKDRITAAGILDYGAQLRSMITRMSLTGTPVDNIIFYKEQSTLAGMSAANQALALFYSSGGGLPWQDTPVSAYGATAVADYTSTDTSSVHYRDIVANLSIPGIGTGKQFGNIVMMDFDISLGVCNAINNAAGISSMPVVVDSGATSWVPMARAVGGWGYNSVSQLTNPPIVFNFVLSDARLTGHPFGCYSGVDPDGNAEYISYYALAER